jgi:hypothetical protein
MFCTAEFIWSSSDKPCTCGSLKPINKSWLENMKFTFDVSKYDRIFDELLRLGHIKLSPAIPPLDELTRRAYYKWHNSFSHATNDCNMLRRQIQLVVDEGRLVVPQMQIEKTPFLVHTIELQDPKILIRQSQMNRQKEKNVIIGEERSKLLKHG